MILLASPLPAYYHFIHYTSRVAPFNPIPEKYDLNTLPNRTLTFFVSDSGPTQLSATDSFPSVLSQIRQAAQVWNSVETSDLRVAFGGLESFGTLQQATPGGDVIFVDDLPPGVLAAGGPVSKTAAVAGPNGSFVPIVRAQIRVNRDLTKAPGPSYLESFFTTIVHEMGHTLGLQHTQTSSAMSLAITRATTRTRPLDLDDIAGLSVLYPTSRFAAQTGSIAGRVTSGGVGVHLASVVAIRLNGSAISAITNPDGTYRIDGVPPDQYLVYVHSLPPSTQDGLGRGNNVLPVDPGGVPVPATGAVESVFFPGTRDLQQAIPIGTLAGLPLNGIDFNVSRRTEAAIYDVRTYTYFGNLPSRPAVLNSANPRSTIVATGTGITAGTSAAPGLSIQMLGGSATLAPGGLRPYSYGSPVQTALALDWNFPPFGGSGPRHLMFSVPGDMYVLPAAINLVQKAPPAITAVFANNDGSATVTGTNIAADSRIFFDGLPATTRSFTGNDTAASVIVVPPAGFPNQEATVTVYNSDGQNSMSVQADNPPTYSYGAVDAPLISITPGTLNAVPAGASAVVDITGLGTHFTDGQTIVGFGSSDVIVRRVFVLSPTRLLANITVAPGAAPGLSEISVVTGFQVAIAPFGFQIQSQTPQAPAVTLPVLNAVSGQTGFAPGFVVTVFGSNLAASPNGSGVTVTVGEQSAPVLFASSTQINFQIPAGLQPGPAMLRIHNGAANTFPVVMQIDPAPPVAVAVLSAGVQAVDSNRPARPGDLVTVIVQNIDPSVVNAPWRVRVSEGGTDLNVLSISPVTGQSGFFQIQVALSPAVVGGQIPVTVSVDGGATSNTLLIAVR